MGPCVESTRTPSQEYPQIYYRGRIMPESRFIWEEAYGPIDPPSLFVCHRCDNKRCIRLDHLFLGTASDNTKDHVAKGRHYGTRLTHCPQGHPYDEADTYWDPGRHRRCRICAKTLKQTRRAAGHPNP